MQRFILKSHDMIWHDASHPIKQFNSIVTMLAIPMRSCTINRTAIEHHHWVHAEGDSKTNVCVGPAGALG